MSFKIVSLGEFYLPDLQGERSPRVLDDVFDSVVPAIMAIRAMYANVYHLQHNEADRPDLLVLDDVDADYIASGRNCDLSNYDWDDAVCDCGECTTCINMMIDQDREYCRLHSI